MMTRFVPFALVLLLFSCSVEERSENAETRYSPILLSRAELEKSIKLLPPQQIVEAGKIYLKDPYLFINEKYKGVHIFDNADPTNPEAIAFIQVPGNVDIAVENDVIYADNSVDLVSLRYTGNQLTELDRQRNVFPEIVAPDLGAVPDAYTEANRPENTVIVGWKLNN